MELLLFPSTSILIAALRMVGNIATGDDLQTRVRVRRVPVKYIDKADELRHLLVCLKIMSP